MIEVSIVMFLQITWLYGMHENLDRNPFTVLYTPGPKTIVRIIMNAIEQEGRELNSAQLIILSITATTRLFQGCSFLSSAFLEKIRKKLPQGKQ